MMQILETVWRTVPWAHAVHYCDGDVLVVLRSQDGWWHCDADLARADVSRELGPDVAVKVIVV